MAKNIEMILTEETQVFLVLGITETVNLLVFIIHIHSFSVSHVSNDTIHLVIHSVSQTSPSPSLSLSNQALGLV